MSSAAGSRNLQDQAGLSRLKVRRLGLVEYEPVWRDMQAFTDDRDEATQDELWLLQHPPVFTQGQSGKAEHVLAPGDIPVLQVDRGGQVTYHGPGQIVAYPLLDIKRLGLGVRAMVCRIEAAIIAVLAAHGVEGERREGAPGVYVDGAKVAALGLRVRRGRSFHGLAFNIDMDLEPFSRINPCGYQGLEVTQLSALADVSLGTVEDMLVQQLVSELGYSGVDE
ncbi:MAG: lipoyl(octanoyl) transferase LipB [Xanthomonadales bacterium]|nr:lipoyl(octanoyl) transferase LipB [Xanthomonadales bacterium]